jgi:serine/threonine-protein kinase
VIAEGGYGVVYRAEHVAFRAPTAVKCLKIPQSMRGQSEAFVERFREEAEILFHLSAQIAEVVRPLHADTITLEDGTFVPYIVMEWVDGMPLDSIVLMREEAGEPPLPLAEAVTMLTPIAHALGRAHHFETPAGDVMSVTHCDLKPENILITAKGSPVGAKILDFGIAKARGAAAQAAGRVTGSDKPSPFTPGYGAPEQWLPKRYGQSGPWTDVWGLALTIVECVTGRPPIDGDNHTMMAMALDAERRPTPRTEGVTISDEVEAVFQRALAIDPRDRYTDVPAFWKDLERACGLKPSHSHAPSFSLQPTSSIKPASAPAIEPKREPVVPLHLDSPAPDAVRALGRELRAPLMLLAGALLITTLDLVLAHNLGGTLMLGPLRARWIAALFAVVGIGLGIKNLLGYRHGE